MGAAQGGSAGSPLLKEGFPSWALLGSFWNVGREKANLLGMVFTEDVERGTERGAASRVGRRGRKRQDK